MALGDILNKIEADARKEAEEILLDAKSTASNMVREGEKKASSLKESLLAKAEIDAAEEEQRRVTLAKLELRKQLLKEKREIIDEAFHEIMAEYTSGSDDKYKSLVIKLISASTKTGREEIIIPKKHAKLWSDAFLSEIKKSVPKFKGDINVVSSDAFEFGFKLRGENSETDCTLETVFKLARQNIEARVAKILFEGA